MAASRFLSRLLTGGVGRVVSRLVGGTPIWERDWDVCCVFDGCRLDLMQEVAGVHAAVPDPSSVESLWSVGSQSAEWMDGTFGPAFRDEMQRTAYVTGNPFSAQSADDLDVTSEDVLPLSSDDWGVLYEAWRDEWVHDDVSTIPPDPLTDAALAIWQHRSTLDVDRVLVHYMQPHAPFRSRPEWFLGRADTESWGQVDHESGPDDHSLTDLSREEFAELERLSEAETDGIRDPWTRLRDGDLPREEFWRAYRDNLEWVLDDSIRLLEGTTARVAFTSDHGNAAGEWGVWSHPPGVPLPSLRSVPWVVRRGAGERPIETTLPEGIPADTATTTASNGRIDDDATERLTDLGYR